MIEHVEIRNFQSLHHVALDLDPFTVIVGASSSGKSALTRALRTLTSNARGAAFITHGERITTLRAVTDRGTVILKRGKGTDDNEYVIIPTTGDEQQRVFTKLSGAVPEEVSDFLGIPAKDPLNYAGQFDTPYLLKDTGGDVARTLGSLTNVNVIFEGARESNRRRLDQSKTLKTRQSDLATTTAKIETYRPLSGQIKAIERAEDHLAQAVALEASIATLRSLIDIQTIAAQSLQALTATAALTVPEEAGILERATRLQGYRDTLASLKGAASSLGQATTTYDEATAYIESEEHAYAEALRTAATCPTCGQQTEHLEDAHV